MVARDDDVRGLLGKFAASANASDIRLLTAGLDKAKKDNEKLELVKEFKKMIRNRAANATVVAAATPAKKPEKMQPPSTPTVSPTGSLVAGSLDNGGGDDDDEFELESLF